MENITWLQYREFIKGPEVGIKFTKKEHDEYYYSRFRVVKEWFGKKELTKENLRSFFTYLAEERKIKRQTINNYRKIIRHICLFFEIDVYKKFKNLTPDLKPKVVLSIEEVYNVLTVRMEYDKDNEYKNEIYPIIHMMGYFCGARISEVVGMRWEHYGGYYVDIPDTKSNEPAKFQILDFLRERIEKLPRFNHGFMFGSKRGPIYDETINNELKLRCKKVGVHKWEEVTYHCLRGSRITHDKHNNVLMTMKFARHKRPETTMRYQQLNQDDVREVTEGSTLVARFGQVSDATLKNKKNEFINYMRSTGKLLEYHEENGESFIKLAT